MKNKIAVMYADAGDEPYVVIYSSKRDAWDKAKLSIPQKERRKAKKALFSPTWRGATGWRTKHGLVMIITKEYMKDRIEEWKRYLRYMDS